MSPLTYQQRNTASEKPAIAALAPGALTYTPGKPQFADLANGMLGNLGTSADGWDGIFNAMAAIVDADIASVTVFDGILAGLGFAPGILDSTLFAPIAAQYTAFAKAGDAALGNYDGKGGGGGGGSSGQSHPPMSAWQHKCREIYPYGYDPTNPGGGDPCTP